MTRCDHHRHRMPGANTTLAADASRLCPNFRRRAIEQHAAHTPSQQDAQSSETSAHRHGAAAPTDTQPCGTRQCSDASIVEGGVTPTTVNHHRHRMPSANTTPAAGRQLLTSSASLYCDRAARRRHAASNTPSQLRFL
jgi:hypothetical protein